MDYIRTADYRHEWKHEINYCDLLTIRQRLRAVAQIDSHTADGRYFIRSLYFDTPADTALWEKLDGISRREKFRIRFYNQDTSLIHLEKKCKVDGLGTKHTAVLTQEEAQSIVNGDLKWMESNGDPLVQDLYVQMTTHFLQPKTIVDYTREPFIYGPGNVRVTLDYDIRTGIRNTDFLNPNCVTVPAGDAPIILEVKWDAFLPNVIRDAIQLKGRRTGAFSKYAQCRVYG
ncbi:MAG: polyphosphate polymerase domain-containing protein [Lachnospiraceae bacterium]|nr:polyphosphate polymerase domain-containing protein [Lachnospiraceae bacterium]